MNFMRYSKLGQHPANLGQTAPPSCFFKKGVHFFTLIPNLHDRCTTLKEKP
ncbi:hypothetical protein M2448_003185 [Dysgonomonas sp. PF1-14]|nr:hypothetical protein [Dysgonomonas sp. PF1-14]